MSDVTRSTLRNNAVNVQIRRYPGVLECDVVIAARGRELIVTCPDYNGARRWAEMECKSYNVPPNFAEQPSGFQAV